MNLKKLFWFLTCIILATNAGQHQSENLMKRLLMLRDIKQHLEDLFVELETLQVELEQMNWPKVAQIYAELSEAKSPGHDY